MTIEDRKWKLQRRCDMLMAVGALFLVMLMLTVPPDTQWARYVAAGVWFAMLVLLIIPRW